MDRSIVIFFNRANVVPECPDDILYSGTLYSLLLKEIMISCRVLGLMGGNSMFCTYTQWLKHTFT